MHERSLMMMMVGIALANSPTLAGPDAGMHDPTQPYKARFEQSVTAPVFIVNAIFISADRRIAIVNRQRVTVGERVGEATVVSISKDYVMLSIDGKRYAARLIHGARRE